LVDFIDLQSRKLAEFNIQWRLITEMIL